MSSDAYFYLALLSFLTVITIAEGHYVLRPFVTSAPVCPHIIYIPLITDLCLFETILCMFKNKICLEAKTLYSC